MVAHYWTGTTSSDWSKSSVSANKFLFTDTVYRQISSTIFYAKSCMLVVGLLDQYKLQQTQFNIVFRLF